MYINNTFLLSGGGILITLFGGITNKMEPAGGLRIFNSNLLTFIFPDILNNTGKFGSFYSNLLPFLNKLPRIWSNQEGYAYLGAGILILLLLCLIISIINIKNVKKIFICYKAELISFTFIFLCSFIYSLSPDIYFLDKIILSIPLPESLENFLNIFRSAGRFIYPAYYILLISVFIIILKYFSKKAAAVLISICLLLQIYDLIPCFRYLHNTYAYAKGIEIIEKNQLRENKDIIFLGKKYLITNPVYSPGSEVIPFLFLALTKNMKTNGIHSARKHKDSFEFFISTIKNPKEDDAFVFYNSEESRGLLKNSELKAIYVIDDIIFATKNPNEKLKEFEIEL